MQDAHDNIILVFDDREVARDEVRNVIGRRPFGDVVFRRQTLFQRFRGCLPFWAASRLFHLRSNDDLERLREALEASTEETGVCIVAGRSGFADVALLRQLVERLPYAEEDFTDRLYKPLLVFLRNAHQLVARWPSFTAAPMHLWEQSWQQSERVASLRPLDLTQIREFLAFMSGSTSTRHFNHVDIDTYYYTKSSADKRKMLAEASFYQLIPESMRPWLIQPFDYRDEGTRASYKMLRYYLADAALQWVHGAFEADTFEPFVDRLLFFIGERPRKTASRKQSAALARELFVTKVQARAQQFLAMEEGRRINTLAASATAELDLSRQIARYLKLYERHEKKFEFDYTVVGHGDPCFSNVLYDQQRFLLKLIDPKGATSEADLYTHPLYDLCKISHSALGDYDFINNGLHTVGFSEKNDLLLRFSFSNHAALKEIFKERVRAVGHDERAMRVGEASLFLSMLPLHIDHPNKVIAFMLKAKQILDEVERG